MPPAVDELIVSTLVYPCKKHSDNPTSFSSNKAKFFCWGKNTSHKSANSLFVTFCLFTWCLKISFSQKYIGYPVNAMLHDKEILISKNKMNVKVE